MKKIILTLFLCLNFYISGAQTIQTVYTRSYKSTFCGKEEFIFEFGKDGIIKTDKLYKTT